MRPPVECIVMYREERRDRAHVLARELGARLVADPRPDLAPTPAGTWRTWRAAWLAVAAAGADYGLVIQDDVLPCSGFRDIVERVVAAHAPRPLTFFSRRTAVRQAHARGAVMVELPPMPHVTTQAIAMCCALVPELVDAGDAMAHELADDERFARWLAARGERPLATVPSLVVHDPAVTSLIRPGRPNTRCQATLTIGDTGVDPATVDWNGPVHYPRRRGRRRGGGWPAPRA